MIALQASLSKSALPANGPRTAVFPSRTALTVACLIALQPAVLMAQLPSSRSQSASQNQPPAPLSIGDAARLAAQRNGAVDVARQLVAQAEARTLQRRGALLPELAAGVQQASRTTNTATFGFEFNDPNGRPLLNPGGEIIGPVKTIDLRYRVTQPVLDLAGFARYRTAQAEGRAASAEVTAQAEAAASSAAAAYIRAERAEAQVTARYADSTLAAELLGIARDVLKAGTGIALDVTRAQSQLAANRAALISARSERDRALLELKRAIGLAFDTPVTLRDSLGGLTVDEAQPDEAAALESAFDRRADVRALLAREEAQQRAVKAIRWERTPQLGLVVDHGVIGPNTSRLLPTYTLGLQLSVGLFDGFRREGRLQEESAGLREVEARLRDLREQSALETRSALLDLASAREGVEAARERLSLAEQEVSQARERFSAGVAGNADVVTALLSLNQARTLRNDALALYQSARLALARATGSVQQLP
jgi:outer membrane protein TolC